METVVGSEACHSRKSVVFEDSLTPSVSVGNSGIDLGRRECATCVADSRADRRGSDSPARVILAHPVAEPETWWAHGDEIDPANQFVVGNDREHNRQLGVPGENFRKFDLIGHDLVRIVRPQMVGMAGCKLACAYVEYWSRGSDRDNLWLVG